MTAEEDLPSVNRTVEEGGEEEELLATKNAPKTSSYAQQYTSTGNHGACTDLASLTPSFLGESYSISTPPKMWGGGEI